MSDINLDRIEKLKFITCTLKTLGESKGKFDDNLEIKRKIDTTFSALLGKLQDMLDIES